MNCIFQKQGNKLVCINCSFSLPYREYKGGVHRNCQKPCKMPKTKNFGQELIKQGKNIAAGGKILVDDETIAKRLEICKLCDHFKNNRCELCGCNMNHKTKLAQSNCPIGKW